MKRSRLFLMLGLLFVGFTIQLIRGARGSDEAFLAKVVDDTVAEIFKGDGDTVQTSTPRTVVFCPELVESLGGVRLQAVRARLKSRQLDALFLSGESLEEAGSGAREPFVSVCASVRVRNSFYAIAEIQDGYGRAEIVAPQLWGSWSYISLFGHWFRYSKHEPGAE